MAVSAQTRINAIITSFVRFLSSVICMHNNEDNICILPGHENEHTKTVGIFMNESHAILLRQYDCWLI